MAAPLVQALAAQAAVPVALALDHGKAFPLIGQAFRAGFTGLMIDASAEPLADNIRQTAAVVKMAHTAGVCVEGELGHIADAPTYELADAAVKMTRVEDVLPFIEQTGIDLLAISVGTAHGLYPPGVKPKIDFERLQQLHAVTTRAGLHGGSGTRRRIYAASAPVASPRSTSALRCSTPVSTRCSRRCASIRRPSWQMCWR